MSDNQFPAFFFHLHLGRKKVFSQKERDDLGPEWADSPTKTSETFAAARNGQPDPETPIGVAAPPAVIPPAQVAVTPAEIATMPVVDVNAAPVVDPATVEEQEKQAVWSAPVGVIVESLEGASSEVLARVKAFEEANPKGPRVTVIRAIEKALATHTSPPNDGPSTDAEPPAVQ
jgi:hypothetical protein